MGPDLIKDKVFFSNSLKCVHYRPEQTYPLSHLNVTGFDATLLLFNLTKNCQPSPIQNSQMVSRLQLVQPSTQCPVSHCHCPNLEG